MVYKKDEIWEYLIPAFQSKYLRVGIKEVQKDSQNIIQICH